VTDKSTAETVAIIGAGIGGLYLVAELGMAGFNLRLHDIDESRLSEIRAHGVVRTGQRSSASWTRGSVSPGARCDGLSIWAFFYVWADRLASSTPRSGYAGQEETEDRQSPSSFAQSGVSESKSLILNSMY